MALRRSMMNVVKNHTDVEVKVREATSNDPWGPSSSLMSYIADATYNVAAFSEIMGMLWKRLNDHGKNWRHVYKSLVVLDYIIKTGSERVGQQCRENIFAVQTLKDFQYIDKDGKDQGVNIREKSKQLVLLLKDDERLKSERQRALKAKERFAQSQGGIGNTNFHNKNKRLTAPRRDSGPPRSTLDDSSIPSSTTRDSDREPDRRSTDGRFLSEMEKARPSNEAEEEMQLQIALAMSREQADQEQHTEKGDEQRLKIVLQRSSSDAQAPQPATTLLGLVDPATSPGFGSPQADPWASSGGAVAQPPPADPWAPPPTTVQTFPPNATPQADPWASQPPPATQAQMGTTNGWTQKSADPWAPAPAADPWAPAPAADPFAPQVSASNGFDPRAPSLPMDITPNPFDMNSMSTGLPGNNDVHDNGFLGKNSKLVDFENIVGGGTAQSAAATNPFGMPLAEKTTNPFAQDKPKPKSINEIRFEQSGFKAPVSQAAGNAAPASDAGILLPEPLIPVNNPPPNNPFL